MNFSYDRVSQKVARDIVVFKMLCYVVFLIFLITCL